MAKKKIKLNSTQKRHLERIKKLQKDGVYVGEQDLKDMVLDGKYAVLSIRNPVFDTIICADDEETARAIMKYNRSSFTRIVNLDTNDMVNESNKSWIPRLSIEET